MGCRSSKPEFEDSEETNQMLNNAMNNNQVNITFDNTFLNNLKNETNGNDRNDNDERSGCISRCGSCTTCGGKTCCCYFMFFVWIALIVFLVTACMIMLPKIVELVSNGTDFVEASKKAYNSSLDNFCSKKFLWIIPNLFCSN